MSEIQDLAKIMRQEVKLCKCKCGRCRTKTSDPRGICMMCEMLHVKTRQQN